MSVYIDSSSSTPTWRYWLPSTPQAQDLFSAAIIFVVVTLLAFRRMAAVLSFSLFLFARVIGSHFRQSKRLSKREYYEKTKRKKQRPSQIRGKPDYGCQISRATSVNAVHDQEFQGARKIESLCCTCFYNGIIDSCPILCPPVSLLQHSKRCKLRERAQTFEGLRHQNSRSDNKIPQLFMGFPFPS